MSIIKQRVEKKIGPPAKVVITSPYRLFGKTLHSLLS